MFHLHAECDVMQQSQEGSYSRKNRQRISRPIFIVERTLEFVYIGLLMPQKGQLIRPHFWIKTVKTFMVID